MASKRSIRQLLSAATAATFGASLTRRPAPEVDAEVEGRRSEAVEIASPLDPRTYGNHRFHGQDGVVEC
ncbi:hypothetical protein PYK79_08655 [Streptomyces sp. ID05-04B]|uniref:hypothetical protein n=1 Tax=Streptomyces sp. ID05-04B TaxID=3028661 RepID=UPI0029C56E8F|nr:hypothetical protein [Streptomyces sp. ID05-04B]MDX5563331.1 hypothetical protein [Streptomyces sp. ID05-04B]